MSKIFDALKQAESVRPDRKGRTADKYAKPSRERRRTARTPLRIPLFVYGYADATPFREDACTVEVNAHGGLLSLQMALRPGQKLLVVNKGNESKQHCTVLSVRMRQERSFDVAFEFLDPMPQFWQELGDGGSAHL